MNTQRHLTFLKNSAAACVAYIFTKAGEDSSMKSRNEATAISKRNVCLRFQDAPISEVLNQALHSTIIASFFVTA